MRCPHCTSLQSDRPRLKLLLEVTFAEDASRIRLDHAPRNVAVLRHGAFIWLKRHLSNASLKPKRVRLPWTIRSCLIASLYFDAVALPILGMRLAKARLLCYSACGNTRPKEGSL